MVPFGCIAMPAIPLADEADVDPEVGVLCAATDATMDKTEAMSDLQYMLCIFGLL